MFMFKIGDLVRNKFKYLDDIFVITKIHHHPHGREGFNKFSFTLKLVSVETEKGVFYQRFLRGECELEKIN